MLKECVDLQNIKLVKKVPQSKITKMYEKDQDRQENFGGDLVDKVEEDEYHSITTLSEDKIFTEESVESQEFKQELV